MAFTRASQLGDVERLAPYLRQADVDEINAAVSTSIKDTLDRAYMTSRPCRSIISSDGKRIVGMYGIVPIPSTVPLHNEGVIWCVTTDELFSIKKEFVKQSKSKLKELCKNYDKVMNMVYYKNTSHIRWLKAMGFNVADKPIPHGYKQELFYYFDKAV